MITNQFPGTDLTVSRLGYGCMRLPTTKQGGKRVIVEERAIDMIRYAIDNSVSYIDTAYPYHDGASELVVGKALKDGYREKVALATKLPVWMVKTREDMDRLLDEQLQKLQTDHIDFYLLHALGRERFHFLQSLGYKDFLDKAVADGRIRYPGFSFHDNEEAFKEIIDDYDWKLAQVQMNILDTDNQATLRGMKYASDKGVGLVVMEPLRGGLMAKQPPEVKALYDAFPVKRSGVEWAFRFLYDIPGVKVILSGMSTKTQVKDNLRIFKNAQPDCMDASERKLVENVKKAYLGRMRTMCTGCAYCQPCPKGVKIPDLFRAYDETLMFDNQRILDHHYAEHVKKHEDPGQCVRCGKCEKACPQHLHIMDMLQEVKQKATTK